MPSMRISTKLVPACSLFCGGHKLRSLWYLPTAANGAGRVFCASYTSFFEIIAACFGSRYKDSTRIVTMSSEMSLLLLFAGAPTIPSWAASCYGRSRFGHARSDSGQEYSGMAITGDGGLGELLLQIK